MQIDLRTVTIDSHRPIFAGPPVRLFQPVQIHVVSQGGESHLRVDPGQFCDPLLFRADVVGCHRTHYLSLQRFRDPAAPSLQRVPAARFPAFFATTSCSDFRPLLPLTLVSFGLRYRPVPPVRSWRGRHTPPGLGSFYVASLTTWLLAETAGSPRFLGNPCARALLSDPGGTLRPGHCGFRVLSSARRTSSTPTF